MKKELSTMFDELINDYAKQENGEQRIAELTLARDNVIKMAKTLAEQENKIKEDEQNIVKTNAVAEELRRINGQLLAQTKVTNPVDQKKVDELSRSIFSYNPFNK